jgi:hypothetical protein
MNQQSNLTWRNVMGNRVIVLEQDAYELLSEMTRKVAVAQLLKPADIPETDTDRAAKKLITAVHGVVPELEESVLGGEGRDAQVKSFTAGSAEGVEFV